MNALTGNLPGDEEDPLDPAVEKIRRRMARLMIVSIGIMVVGLAAVFGAILFKLNSNDEDGSESRVATTNALSVPTSANYIGKIDLPDGAKILSSSLSGSQVLLRIETADGGQQLWLYDIPSGRQFGTIEID